MPTSRKKRKSS